MSDSEQGNKRELFDLLQDFDTAMLVTVEADGRLRARPMSLQKPGEIPGCDLWLASADDSGKTHEIEHDRQVNLSCLRSRDGAYITISARARVERNPDVIESVWKPDWKLWFGDAHPDDGEIVLLKLDIERAEYWKPEGGRLRVLYSIVKGLVTDEPAEASLNPPKRIG